MHFLLRGMAAVLKFNTILPLFLFAVASHVKGQTCPDEWVQFRESCYAFVDEQVPWTSADDICGILGGKMLEVETQEENDFIAGQIRSRSGIENVWIGLQDFLREGRWVWNSNLEPATYFNWEAGEPNNDHHHEGGQDCAYIKGGTGQWDDGWCDKMGDRDSQVSVACEKDLTVEEIVG